ncbi:MAG: nucleoside-diphosphate kinase [Candidatus Nomurabacteria bacterium]|nr:MAG: nucleoside-diphosphate kinase [Candidatus Nomurabacteria bacterium]HRV76200.1 nucleoside-diphosphate kinase [Candidatus Saccharimonadales bacterium]
MIERTLVILKPDAVSRGLMGEIVSRFERVGLKIVGAKLIKASEDLANKHYPRDREEFILGMAQKTVDNYKAQGKDLMEDLGTEDLKEIGLMIQGWLVDNLTSGPVFAFVIEGPHAIEVVRKLIGSTLPLNAAPGTIRGDFSFDSSALGNEGKRPIRNLVHASGEKDEAEFEVNLWFSEEEIYEYETVHQRMMIL